MMLIVAAQVINLIFVIAFSDHGLWSTFTLLKMIHIMIVAICILIVSIPEGMPLAVSIAMALSISKLKEDSILIKNLESIQTAAMLHDVCIGKTGTITTGRMTVASIHLIDQKNI